MTCRQVCSAWYTVYGLCCKSYYAPAEGPDTKETKESGGKAAEVGGDDEGMQNKVVGLLLARAASFLFRHAQLFFISQMTTFSGIAVTLILLIG